MKKNILIIIAVIFVELHISLAAAQDREAATQNEDKQTRFAERVVAIQLVRTLSAEARATREKSLEVCPETGAVELAIGLMGVARGKASADGLVNLLGLRLDGAGSEELSCQILIRGSSVSRSLELMQPKKISEHCQSILTELRKRELAGVSDVKVEQVCRSEADIRKIKDSFLKAVKSKTKCEQ